MYRHKDTITILDYYVFRAMSLLVVLLIKMFKTTYKISAKQSIQTWHVYH